MRNPKSNPFEDTPILKQRVNPRPRPRFISKDVLENGAIVRKCEVEMHDYSVPFTPQSGIETLTGNLSAMVKMNMQIGHETSYMTNLGTNPIAIERLDRAAAASFERLHNAFEKQERESKKTDND